MAFGRLRGPRVQELKSSGGVLYSVQSTLPEAGGQSPGRVLGVTPWGPLAAAFAVAWAEHANSCGLAGHRLFRHVSDRHASAGANTFSLYFFSNFPISSFLGVSCQFMALSKA